MAKFNNSNFIASYPYQSDLENTSSKKKGKEREEVKK